MALVKATLQTKLAKVFSDMDVENEETHEKDNATSEFFAKGVSEAIVSYVSTGQVSTTDTGTVSAGTLTASGVGTLTVESGYKEEVIKEQIVITWSGCAKIIKDACNKMKKDGEDGKEVTDNYLAEELGKAIKKMADDGEVKTTVNGSAVAGNVTTTITGASAKGTISVNNTNLIEKLKEAFASKSFSNNSFAQTLADEIDKMYKAGQVSTDGEGAIKGATGSGSIS